MNKVAFDYTQALRKVNEAYRVFTEITKDYRTKKIGDVEYLKARAKYKEAEKEFDAVYAKI